MSLANIFYGKCQNKRATGKMAEEIATVFLQEKGFKILEKNFHCHFGEIDLIIERDNYIIFVEVKARSSKSFGLAQEAVTIKKQKKILNVAMWYLMKNNAVEKFFRFDVIAMHQQANGQYDIQHIENAFDATR